MCFCFVISRAQGRQMLGRRGREERGVRVGFFVSFFANIRVSLLDQWQALATATYVVNMMFIKLSIAVFLLRLAVQKPYKYTLWISMVVVAIWSSVIFIWDIFQCSPVQAQRDYTIPNLQCVTSDQIVSAAYSISVMTILTDWLYALLPIPMVWKVKMTKQAKATVVVILGLGIL